MFYFNLDENSVSKLIDRIKEITPLKKLEEIGISQQVISNWKTRNTFPKSDDLYRISTLLNVSMEYLLTGNNSDRFIESELPDKEIELLKNYRILDEPSKHHIDLIVEALTGK